MKNISIGLIELAVIAGLFTFNSGLVDFLWLIPLPIILFVNIIINYKTEQKLDANTETNENSVSLKDIIKVKLFDVIVLLVFILILFLPLELMPIPRSSNIFAIPILIILNMNIFRPTLGSKFLKIKMENRAFLTKLKILLNNFLIVSPVYFGIFFNMRFGLNNIGQRLFEILCIINLLSFFIRFLKNKSLFEFVLGIEYYRDNI